MAAAVSTSGGWICGGRVVAAMGAAGGWGGCVAAGVDVAAGSTSTSSSVLGMFLPSACNQLLLSSLIAHTMALSVGR